MGQAGSHAGEVGESRKPCPKVLTPPSVLPRPPPYLLARNRSTKDYHWQIVRPHAAQAFGDQRINPFGIGGQVEIRAGLLAQTQPITGPQVHFGLGEQTKTDVIRVIWPNGAVRAEFDVKADQDVATEQRLKGQFTEFAFWAYLRFAGPANWYSVWNEIRSVLSEKAEQQDR